MVINALNSYCLHATIIVHNMFHFVTESFEIYVGYKPQYYLKELPTISVLLVKDLELVDFDSTLLYDVPSPLAPALPVEDIGKNEIIDLTFDIEPRAD